MSALVNIFSAVEFDFSDDSNVNIEDFNDSKIEVLMEKLKEYEAQMFMTATISKSEKDYIHMSHIKNDKFLFQFDRQTKSGGFWKRLTEMKEPSFETSSATETRLLISNYLKWSRYDFESKYS